MHWRRAGLLACSALAPLLVAAPAQANPEGAQVVAGQVTMGAAGQTLTVNQASARAVVNWNSFSIGAGETTRFVQPSAASAILNRVTGGDASALMGQLQANGRVYLINPHGVVIGREGRVDTGGFVASTLDTPDDAFLSGGPLTFQGLSGAGIKVLGAVKASDGDVVLVAASVENQGQIAAPNGRAILGAGASVLYMPAGGGDIVIAAPSLGARVDNSGTIAAAEVQLKAAGGVHALAVNLGGAVSASAVRNLGGRVVIDGGEGNVTVSGAITARRSDDGGEVSLTGRDLTLAAASRIDADAGAAGDGGAVTVLGAGTTRFEGLISARGGAEAGDGGQVEVSGGTLKLGGQVDASAPHGRGGRLLLDPVGLDLDATAVATVVATLAGADVTSQSPTGLTVSAPISSASTHTLILRAPDIAVNADISLANGRLQIEDTSGTAGSLVLASAATITAHELYIQGTFDLVDLQGAVVTPRLLLDDTAANSTFTATNAANQIDLLTTVGQSQFSGDVAVTSSTAMSVGGHITTSGALSLRTLAGNLTFGSGTVLTVTGATRLAAGGTFINNAGTGLLAGAGRKLIWASSATGFNDGGLGYTQQSGVTFPTDAAGAGNVIYFGAAPVLTITANSFSRVYGQANPAFTVSYSGGSASDLTTAVRLRVLGGGVNAGSYTIEPFGAVAPGFTPAYVNGTLTVTRAPLTVTANSFSRLYGDAGPAFTASYSGLVNGDTGVAGLTFATPATFRSGVGTYAIQPQASSANYALTFVNGVLTVTPAPLTITGDSFSRSYGAANFPLTATFSGLVAGDTGAVVSGLSVQTAATVTSDVGDYAITLGAPSATNYTITAVNGVASVTRAPLTVTIGNASRPYRAVNPLNLSFSGLMNGDTEDVLTDVAFSTGATLTAGVGDYTLHMAATARNYALTFVDGVITVTQRALVVVTPSTSRLYGAANPVFSVELLSGLASGDTLETAVPGLRFTTTATTRSGVGTYSIVPEGTWANYRVIQLVPATLTVKPAPLRIIANDATRVYGHAVAQALTYRIEGLVNGDTGGGFGDHLVFGAPPLTQPVGTYAIGIGGGADPPNYQVTFVSGVMTITKAPLTITANNVQRVQGASQPAFTATFSGLVNGDSPPSTPLKFVSPYTLPDTYPIKVVSTPELVAATRNYELKFVDGKLTIVPSTTQAVVTTTSSGQPTSYTSTMTQGKVVTKDPTVIKYTAGKTEVLTMVSVDTSKIDTSLENKTETTLCKNCVQQTSPLLTMNFVQYTQDNGSKDVEKVQKDYTALLTFNFFHK